MTIDFSQIYNADIIEEREAILAEENARGEEDLCVGCGFRLKQENSLFCDRDKCIRGTFEVTSAEGNVLFVGISEEAKAYHKNREGN